MTSTDRLASLDAEFDLGSVYDDIAELLGGEDHDDYDAMVLATAEMLLDSGSLRRWGQDVA